MAASMCSMVCYYMDVSNRLLVVAQQAGRVLFIRALTKLAMNQKHTWGSILAASSAVLTERYSTMGVSPSPAAGLNSPAAQLSALSSIWLRWYVRAGNMPRPDNLMNRFGLEVLAMMLRRITNDT
jgi:hypothetical protein